MASSLSNVSVAMSMSTESSSSVEMVSKSDFDERMAELDETLRNFTGILQDRFPNVKISDIPGLDSDISTSTSTNFLFFMLSLLFAIFWVTYLVFFHSRIVGKLVSIIISYFVAKKYDDLFIHIGSISWAVLAGKAMFRDVVIVNKDLSVRVVDGYLVFRWWRLYVPKDVSEDLSHSDTRVSLQLNGLEGHLYNRCSLYCHLEKLFNDEATNKKDDEADDSAEHLDRDSRTSFLSSTSSCSSASSSSTSSYILGKKWRDLIPVIKVDISMAKLVLGNRLLPSTMVVVVEEGHLTYSTKPAASSLDHFMHFVKARLENTKLLLAQSPKFTGLRDEAPRFMGEGFVVMATNELDLYYYMDEPGLVPLPNEQRGEQGGQQRKQHRQPEWGVDLRCGKQTSFSYGPWADKQRDLLYKFFFPQDYAAMKTTNNARPGERRRFTCFKVRLSTQCPATMDILFSKHKETSAVHLNLGQGTNFELNIPWIVSKDGYTSTLSGTLMVVEATTSLPFRQLAQTETLEIRAELHYPRIWNQPQSWSIKLVATRASAYFIHAHKLFFQDLMDDWCSSTVPDLLFFVPYTWHFEVSVTDFELISPTNAYNYIDTSSQSEENAYIGICGSHARINFELPFTEFLPETISVNFDIKGHQGEMVLFLPETNTSREYLLGLSENSNLGNKDNKRGRQGWRQICQYDEGWVDCWYGPEISLGITFVYHPMPVPGPMPQADMSTPDKESYLLGPLRAPFKSSVDESGGKKSKSPFDSDDLEADRVVVKLNFDDSSLCLYGTLIRNFMHLKENLFGRHLNFTPMDSEGAESVLASVEKNGQGAKGEQDRRIYRPLDVVLDLRAQRVNIHLMRNCDVMSDLSCPSVKIEELRLEMDKTHSDLRLQITAAPLDLCCSTNFHQDIKQPQPQRLRMQALQFRAQGFFSDVGRTLEEDSLEYAWLIELQCGALIGCVSVSEIKDVSICLEALLLLGLDRENELKKPSALTVESKEDENAVVNVDGLEIFSKTLKSEDVFKYKFFRFLIDFIDVHVAESDSAFNIKAAPVRLSTCNLHNGLKPTHGLTLLCKSISIHQFISTNLDHNGKASVDVNRMSNSHSFGRSGRQMRNDLWLEVGSLRIGSVFVEAATTTTSSFNSNLSNNLYQSSASDCRGSFRDEQQQQRRFLLVHDKKQKRLWSIWPNVGPNRRKGGSCCGCVGGCDFFGLNTNGINFFEPSHEDIARRHNVALPTISNFVTSPGFGQSILHEGQLAITVPSMKYYEKLFPPGWPEKIDGPRKLDSSHPTFVIPSTIPRSRTKSASNKRRRNSSSSKTTTNAKGQCSIVSSIERRYCSNVHHVDLTNSVRVNNETSNSKTSSREDISLLSPSLTSDTFVTAPLDSSKSRDQTTTITTNFETPLESTLSKSHEPAMSPSSSSLYADAKGYDYFSSSSSLLSAISIEEDDKTLNPDSFLSLDNLPNESEQQSSLIRRDSSTSFVSALSEQLENEVGGEADSGDSDNGDIDRTVDNGDIVDLQDEASRPVTQSPFLMSSYLSHLQQLKCLSERLKHQNMISTLPKTARNDSGSFRRSLQNSQLQALSWPEFFVLQEGFNSIQMRPKANNSKKSQEGRSRDVVWDEALLQSSNQAVNSEEASLSHKTTIVLNIQKSIDVICTPISLEPVERMLSALSKSLAKLHPMSVLGHLHRSSSAHVESRNTLQKEHSLQERVDQAQPSGKVRNSNKSKESKLSTSSNNSNNFRRFEKSFSSRIQGSLNLPEFNLMAIQAFVVEERCNLEVLEKIRDITCVSLFALGMKETIVNICNTSKAKKSVVVCVEKEKPFGRKNRWLNKHRHSKHVTTDFRESRLPLAFESFEDQKEELLVSISVHKVHSQLRRLRNNCSLLHDASITAIDEQNSKVFFEYHDPLSKDLSLKEKMGFNMCECGFEGIGVRFAKRSTNSVDDKQKTCADNIDISAVTDKDDVKVTIIPTSHGNNTPRVSGDGVNPTESSSSTQGRHGSASGQLELRHVWFNFAAPPKSPLSRRPDFTRLDWNLLSTATPTFDAWLGPIDRLQKIVSGCVDQYHSRVAAIVACLMTESLDAATEHRVKASKYNKLTSLAKMLRDDPSCQLCTVLQHYLRRGHLKDVMEALAASSTPPLTTLRQGIVVLARQWKNALYTPILLEYNLRCRSLKNVYGAHMHLDPVKEEDTDEEDEEGVEYNGHHGSVETDALLPTNNHLTPPEAWKSSRVVGFKHGSFASDFSFRTRLSPHGLFSPVYDENKAFLRRSTNASFIDRCGSVVSGESIERLNSLPSDFGVSDNNNVSGVNRQQQQHQPQEENLYEWMKRQQRERETINTQPATTPTAAKQAGEEITQNEYEEGFMAQRDVQQQRSVHLLDAHIIFEPLLSSLGLMPRQIQNLSLKNLGYNLSFLGEVESIQVDIFESKESENANSETAKSAFLPSFVCSKVHLQMDYCKETDMGSEKVLPLYVTKAHLKRNTKGLVHFEVYVDFISQKVNMPLLRLLNQIATMHQNVRETNDELRQTNNDDSHNDSNVSHKEATVNSVRPRASVSSSNSSIAAALAASVATTTTLTATNPTMTTTSTAFTPSPSSTFVRSSHIRVSRPRSLTDKLRPSSRLGSSSNSPNEWKDSFILTNVKLDAITEEQSVQCWKTMYSLLELYSIMPTTKTVLRQSLTPLTSSTPIHDTASQSRGDLNRRETDVEEPATATAESMSAATKTMVEASNPKLPSTTKVTKEVSFAKDSRSEHVPLVIFGVVRIKNTKLSANLSGLQLDGTIRSVQSSIHYQERLKTPVKGYLEASVTGSMRELRILLSEEFLLNSHRQVVVELVVNRSKVIHSSQLWKLKDRNLCTMAIDLVKVDIPQHPVDLHGIVMRGTKELSSTLEEFRGIRTSTQSASKSNRNSEGTEVDDEVDMSTDVANDNSNNVSFTKDNEGEDSINNTEHVDKLTRSLSSSAMKSSLRGSRPAEESRLIKPFVMQFNILLHKLVVGAALLPSLCAEYCMQGLNVRGSTGSKAKFVMMLPKHCLSFNTKIDQVIDTTLPQEAAIELPLVSAKAELIIDAMQNMDTMEKNCAYLTAEAEIGSLEHCLTTDLLNHLVLVQKVFVKEVNEVVQKMSGQERPASIFLGNRLYSETTTTTKPLVFSILVRLKTITVTAITPANSGVRFETGLSELKLSNVSLNGPQRRDTSCSTLKLWTRAKVHVKLSLGQLVRDPIYFEAEPQFVQQAYFKTTILLRNSHKREDNKGNDNSRDSCNNNAKSDEVIQISLSRPLIFVQPVAIDRAILFWLSYKNAWEYWNEQRLNLNNEVLMATERLLEKMSFGQMAGQLRKETDNLMGSVFIQLNVADMGLCVPLTESFKNESDFAAAIVATIDRSSIAACSLQSTVCRGDFQKLALRFCHDFNHFLDDWKPDVNEEEALLNMCVVEEGSFDVCTMTTNADKTKNAKWLLNIQWHMTGVDANVDTNIGKYLSSLASTLTSLTTDNDIGRMSSEENSSSISDNDDSDDDDVPNNEDDDEPDNDSWKGSKQQRQQQQIDLDLPAFLLDPKLSKSQVAKFLEQEINEQARVVEDLQKLGASENTVAAELKKLNELQSIASKNFRLELAEKLRRQRDKAYHFKEKFGIGVAASPMSGRSTGTKKSKSFSSASGKMAFVSPSISTGSVKTGLSKHLSMEETQDRSRPLRKAVTIEEEEDEDEIDADDDLVADNGVNEEARSSPRLSTSVPLLKPCVPSSEPNVDLEFHLHISINSGQCRLLSIRESEERLSRESRISESPTRSSSSRPTKKPSSRSTTALKTRNANSSHRLRDLRAAGISQEVMMTFQIPGLDARVHYLSTTLPDPQPSPTMVTTSVSNQPWSVIRNKSQKKATLTTWVTLQSIPEETVITPRILDFLERALEPVPTFGNQPLSSTMTTASPATKLSPDSESSDVLSMTDSNGGVTTSLLMPTSSSLSATSFPVDVIVFFHMQSSTFRFSCLPVSRVECLLRLPSLDLVLSSKRPDEEEERRVDDDSLVGGLNITGRLSDFSLYVFHPYGGRKRRPEDTHSSPLTSEERKDSLSVRVAFVKFHISRSRRLNFDAISLESSQRLSKTASRVEEERKSACVRFSTVVDVGSASFKYDMRRLTEILAFPKAWYRRKLVRRLFLGEMSTTSFHKADDEESNGPNGVSATTSHTRRASSTASRSTRASRGATTKSDVETHRRVWVGQTTAHSWETLVVVALQFKELNVTMNMSNVMGHVEWVTRDLTSEARLSIASSGHRNLRVKTGLSGSRLEAKSGIVSGLVVVGQTQAFCLLTEDGGIEPFHKVGVLLDVLEARFDYMSTSILMARISRLNAVLKDDWHVASMSSRPSSLSASSPPQIFIQGDLSYDQCQLILSKSTAADLIKIHMKLEEFFTQQFRNSKKLFSSLEPLAPWNATTMRDSPHAVVDNDDTSNYRHWQRPLSKVSLLKLFTISSAMPEWGCVLGGVLEIRGQHISIACFHGVNFKSKQWALFSLRDPLISFVSDAQQTFMRETEKNNEKKEETRKDENCNENKDKEGKKQGDEETLSTVVIQTLSFSLGEALQQQRSQESPSSPRLMGLVKRISRSVTYLPPIKDLHDWFLYAFHMSELDEVARFPTLSTSTSLFQRDKSLSHQKAEEVFAFPGLRFDLKTRHVQSDNGSRMGQQPKRPVVECTFVTDFDNHIYVTTDAEAYFFLHDLITSYVKEKERMVSSVQERQTSRSTLSKASIKSAETPNNASSSDENSSGGVRDGRHFDCHTWHLEPTVRVISWAGSDVEPYGVDYILQRLGFSHARTTIPKWIQRGCMDPLDRMLSTLVLRAVQAVQEETNSSGKLDPK